LQFEAYLDYLLNINGQFILMLEVPYFKISHYLLKFLTNCWWMKCSKQTNNNKREKGAKRGKRYGLKHDRLFEIN